MQKKLALREKRRTHRVRNAFQSKGIKPRVSVFRSLNHVYAQIIDDSQQKTLISFSSLNLKNAKGDKKAIARRVGIELGKKARELSIGEVYFDRGSYLYHGRVKELAEGLREGGLVF